MAGRRIPRRQRGVALMIFLVLVVIGALAYLMTSLTPEEMRARRDRQTQESLAQAREALLGYALQYRDRQIATGQFDQVYGFLPLPDLGTSRNQNVGCVLEGCDAANFSGNAANVTVIGRFPWRTLGIEPLRDGDSECLWYAVSGSHQRIQQAAVMNWDTPGQLDIVVANGTTTLASALTSAHDRPVAVIFAPGPPLPGQNRAASLGDEVTTCGGNYDAGNYLDPATAGALGTTSNYFPGAINNASGDTGPTPKALSVAGAVDRRNDATLWAGVCPAGGTCTTVANDRGLALSGDGLFGALRQSSNFRLDINSLLDRMVGCLRDQSSLTQDLDFPAPTDKTTARIPASPSNCYGDDLDPKGYFSHYRDLVFVAKPGSGTLSVNGQNCAGVLMFASQRNTAWSSAAEPSGNTPRCPTTNPANTYQCRTSATEKNVPANYLEGENLAGFILPTATAACPGGSDCRTFSGPEKFERVSSSQTAYRDIVRCIPSTQSLVAVESPGLTALGLPQLAAYDPSTQTLALGREIASALPSAAANALYGCAWRPETHAMGGGLRAYFKFRINDSGWSTAPLDGFNFAIADGDGNGTNACGAALQHLGYSGNNLVTPFIAPPKIGFEIDMRTQGAFNPASSNTLSNGRNDPSYTGGHVALVYWGGETPIATGTLPPCAAPRVEMGGACYLRQEEDDNVHGQAASGRSGFPVPPANPAAPPTPTVGGGVYKLDPNLSQVPANQDIHVRIEISRAVAAYELPTARVATTGNIVLASPGAQIDGVVLAAGDRALVKDQVNPAENGVYVWNGANAPMTRAGDAASAVALAGLLMEVQQGSRNAQTVWRQSATHPMPDSDALRWVDARVKVATGSGIDLAAPGPVIDGITPTIGDRVLVKNQADAADNGIYLWNGASAAMTRAPDALPAAASGATVQIQQGAEATAWWRYDGAAWQRLAPARVAAQSPIDLSAAPAAIDGITPASGDRILVKAQANPAQNGIYTWNGATQAMARAAGADSAAALAGALVLVRDGTDAGRSFRQTALAASAVIDSSPVQWTAIDPAPRYVVEAWILKDSATTANQIAAMKLTSRPMSLLYPGFAPHLHDTPTIPYPFRNVRLGFTIGQRTATTDQTLAISDFSTTWLE